MERETYASAGVDIDAALKLKKIIAKMAQPTFGPEVMRGIGFFGGLYEFKGYNQPILVSHVDGVGTKMKIAIFTNNYLPNPFGVANSIESFRKQFEKMGHLVYIFAPNAKCDDSNERVFRYPAFDFNYKVSYPLPIPFSKKIDRVIEKFLENKWDFVSNCIPMTFPRGLDCKAFMR